MKELAATYLALLLITVAGCSTTRKYSVYDPHDRAALVQENVVKIELTDGTVYFGTSLRFGTDWLSFVVASDEGWPPPSDFHTYDMGVPFESITGLSNTAKEANARKARIAMIVIALSAVVIGLSLAVDKFCAGRDSPDHPLCN